MDVDELRAKFVGHVFDTAEVSVREADALAFARACGETDPRFTDPARYRLDGEELVFDRSFGRPRNAVVLPAGYYLTNSSIPAVVSETGDGRIRLDFTNPRPDEIAVLITARKRRAPGPAAR